MSERLEIQHRDIPLLHIHQPYRWVVANDGERNNVVPSLADVNKYLLQEDTGKTYRCVVTGDNPLTWDWRHIVTKEDIGLVDVDNTSDADKPVSTAQQEALNLKADQTYLISEVGRLDSKIDTKANDSDISAVGKSGNYNDLTNKPDLSVLEEVLVFDSFTSFPMEGVVQKVYIAEDTGFMYRWGGSYVQLTDQTAIWGNIGGDINNQTDLINLLDGKADDSSISAVGKSGEYSDLLNKPTLIPEAPNDGKSYIRVGGEWQALTWAAE